MVHSLNLALEVVPTYTAPPPLVPVTALPRKTQFVNTGAAPKEKTAPPSPAELPMKLQRVNGVSLWNDMSNAPPSIPLWLPWKRQSVKDGVELVMYPAPPPTEERL